ncbi:MAG: hypothetical protein ISP43_10425 [Candidatus Puniceispirillum sp.]|nr:hypothetical protein [Candidatus Puniceispirillum sp.]
MEGDDIKFRRLATLDINKLMYTCPIHTKYSVYRFGFQGKKKIATVKNKVKMIKNLLNLGRRTKRAVPKKSRH